MSGVKARIIRMLASKCCIKSSHMKALPVSQLRRFCLSKAPASFIETMMVFYYPLALQHETVVASVSVPK